MSPSSIKPFVGMSNAQRDQVLVDHETRIAGVETDPPLATALEGRVARLETAAPAESSLESRLKAVEDELAALRLALSPGGTGQPIAIVEKAEEAPKEG
jgi:hypothetical protein